jgi:hypothetical protein
LVINLKIEYNVTIAIHNQHHMEIDWPSEIYAKILLYCHPRDFYALCRVSQNAANGARAAANTYREKYIRGSEDNEFEPYRLLVDDSNYILSGKYIASGKFTSLKFKYPWPHITTFPISYGKLLIHHKIASNTRDGRMNWAGNNIIVLVKRDESNRSISHYTIYKTFLTLISNDDLSAQICIASNFKKFRNVKHGLTYKYMYNASDVSEEAPMIYDGISAENINDRVYRGNIRKISYHYMGVKLISLKRPIISKESISLSIGVCVAVAYGLYACYMHRLFTSFQPHK